MDVIVQYFSGFYGKLELLATILLIANVYLLGRQKLVNYYFGAAGVILYGFIFLEYKLYSDMLLQWVFYLPLQAFGYYWWKYRGAEGIDSVKVKFLGTATNMVWISGALLVSYMLGTIMSLTTDASFPYADALTTVMSIVASILMLNKYAENWIWWITMDVLAIYIYYQKELYVTSGLYVIFLGLASYGLIAWYNSYISGRMDRV